MYVGFFFPRPYLHTQLPAALFSIAVGSPVEEAPPGNRRRLMAKSEDIGTGNAVKVKDMGVPTVCL